MPNGTGVSHNFVLAPMSERLFRSHCCSASSFAVAPVITQADFPSQAHCGPCFGVAVLKEIRSVGSTPQTKRSPTDGGHVHRVYAETPA